MVRVVVWFQGQGWGRGRVLRWRSGSRFGMGVGVGFHDEDRGRGQVLGQGLGSSFRTRFGSSFGKWVQDRSRGWVSGFTPFLRWVFNLGIFCKNNPFFYQPLKI